MKITERLLTIAPASDVAAVLTAQLQGVYVSVERMGSQSITASDPKNITWDARAAITIERENDLWLVTADHHVKMKPTWMIAMAGISLWHLFSGNIGWFAIFLTGIFLLPVVQEGWRGQKITKALALAKSSLESQHPRA